MAIQYKQKCYACKKNYVTVTRRQPFAMCWDCQEKELSGEVKDPEMKKMFDIPLEYYKKSSFLRDIKSRYLRFGALTENQIKAFKKVSEEMKGNPQP
ncbi:MAG: hypothetical protein KJ601_00265 [Nanoarchaeota archaeon]|nr:hypothetical protein [Nanoarchaeota archaeon]